MSVQLHDNVGAGQSLLETVLRSRVDPSGIVPKTTTTLVLALACAQGSTAQDICDLHVNFLGETDVDVTGLLLVHGTVAIHCLEASPETCTGLLRHLLFSHALIDQVRVVASIEDCPTRSFGPWGYRTLSLPPDLEVVHDSSAAGAVAGVAHSILRSLTQCGQAMQRLAHDTGNIQVALDELQGDLSLFLPSAERVAWLARSEKLVSARQYLEALDCPLEYRSAAATMWP